MAPLEVHRPLRLLRVRGLGFRGLGLKLVFRGLGLRFEGLAFLLEGVGSRV